MKTLIRLELRRTNFRTYVISALIIAVIMLGFLYLFAYAPMLETNDADMKIFSGYENLIPLYGVLNMTVFCVSYFYYIRCERKIFTSCKWRFYIFYYVSSN